jgi:RNA polymerase sigma-70 factor (ECF subfamily)
LALRQEELTSLCDDVDLDRDRALVERCQAGDSAAFGNLYARYYERLLRFCLRRLNDRHEAEDAAQEAFARAWKALPRFAGERRFYPWLTVIAGNICTDMLRRRSRSTPTDDMELTAQHPVGVVDEDTSEDLVLAAVDGELVNRALDRLSTRHRHVLAMREGSGWTYQQIADHEGIEIGTIETLLWRARQALKREFAVVSESKEALAGFLIATGAFFRRSIFRMAHRGAAVQQQSGNAGGLRDAVARVAVTGAAVAAAITAPIAFLSGPTSSAPTAGPPSAVVADPPLLVGGPAAASAATAAGANGAAGAAGTGGVAGTGGALGGVSGVTGGSGSPSGGVLGVPGAGTVGGTGGVSGGLNQAAGGVTNAVGGVTSTVGGAVGGVTGGLSGAGTNGGGLGGVTNGVTNGVSNPAGGAVGGLSTTISGLLGGATSGLSGGTSSPTSNPTPTTTTTTTPLGGVLGGLGTTVKGVLGSGG